jgi:hypothetical protein
MDETVEKKVRSLKLKLLMAERELHASSGKWKLGAMLGAGHLSQMNREVVKLKDRLESKIEKLKKEISELTGEALDAVTSENKPNAAAKPIEAPVKKAAEKAKEAPVKKAAAKMVEEKKPAAKKAAPAKAATKKATKKK